MCNALSPERAVIWALLSERAAFEAVKGVVRAEHFSHGDYRKVYAVCERAYRSEAVLDETTFDRAATALGLSFGDKSKRGIRRMLRTAPGVRQSANVERLAQAVADIHHGRPVALHSLIN